MRFGLFIPQGWRLDLAGIEPADQWAAMRDLAQYADSGDAWESIWVFDHFHTVPEPTDEATHEAWTLMSAFAATTQRVRMGQMCTCVSYRNPAYLAKVAATVDIISGGRVEMGIGAGWYEHEWLAYGYGFPRPGVRLGRLDEGVQIMRQMWTGGVATLDGEHYQVDGAICHPLPLQRPHIPLWIAGGGEKVTLRIVAQHADYANVDGTPEVFRHKAEVLRGHCLDVGRDFGQITLSADYNVVIGRDEAEVSERKAWLREHYLRYAPRKGERYAKQLAEGPTVGTPEQIVESLQALAKDGLAYGIFNFADAAYDRSSIELFEREVIPNLR
ncbi:MAG TPA: LLM class F420-dependent oxidoreductase [Actinomycetales bacterium]|nr:LLM class F420-dependent oxidoreductase [Actinomycetales bacterium]